MADIDTLRELAGRLRSGTTSMFFDGRPTERKPPSSADIKGAAAILALLDENERLRATFVAMRDRDDRNGSLPPWYREQIDAALSAHP